MNDNVKIKKYNNLENGQVKCPNCGATDIYINEKNGLLKCNYCRNEFVQKKLDEVNEDLSKLYGKTIGASAQNIAADAKDIITIKCQGCGAEVMLDTSETVQARCHWCRSFLSLNQQVPNGSVPDVVLPFSIKKEEAELKIKEFVKKRNFFAHPKFKKEFTTENIMGVYFPYMLVDLNTHATFEGEGEIETRRYTVGSGDNKETYYDADLYEVGRDFDITIDDLSVEANSDRLNLTASEKTNNIINAIMPFDTENCVIWNANYLKGFSSEKRDTNIEQLNNIVNTQAKDISRIAINETLKKYDRGVCWKKENIYVKGERWKTAYLPVWLYSYQQKTNNKNVLHYVAVNARTKETMGSVPINMAKLIIFTLLIELLGIFTMVAWDYEHDWLSLAPGIIFYIVMYVRYRNSDKRHKYEKDTKRKVFNIKSIDKFIKSKRRLRNRWMSGANNTKVEGDRTKFFKL